MKPSVQGQVQDDDARMEVVEVRSVEQLAAVAGFRSLRQFMSPQRLLLRIASVQRPLQQATERRLNFWLGVCGCRVGALLFLGELAWQIEGPSRAHASILEAVLLGGGWVVAAGILGKATAVLIARAMFMAEAALFLQSIRRGPEERGLPT